MIDWKLIIAIICVGLGCWMFKESNASKIRSSSYWLPAWLFFILCVPQSLAYIMIKMGIVQ